MALNPYSVDPEGRCESHPLRMGRIDFINVLPVHRHLRPRESLFVEVPAVPSRLNQMLRSGELDVSPISSAAYARHPEPFRILPGLSISCRGPVGSVLLFSEVPMEALSGGALEAPYESETAIALLQVLLKGWWRVDVRIIPEGSAEEVQGRLRIGDRALQEAASSSASFLWDLGEVWWRWTGLPFVFALWVAREEAVARRRKEVELLHGLLLEARDRGLQDLEGCAEDAASRMGGDPKTYIEYYGGLGYSLGPEELSGLERFFQELVRLGVVRQNPRLRFL